MQLYNIAVLKDTASFYHQAPAEVKAAADYITLDVDRGGIAAIKKFLL
jgi:hydroxymethylpyrimidine pyrophosphatase-like HAD family hydrolase